MDGIQHQGIGYPMPTTPWTMHDITATPHDARLRKLGEIPAEQLHRLQEMQVPYFAAGWPLETSALDRDISKRFDVDLNILDYGVDEPEVVNFASRWDGMSTVEQIIIDQYPAITSHRRSVQAFESYFAHEHSDEMDICRAQIMIIYENPMGHRLYSRSENSVETLLTPRAGDIVLLDTISIHALLPVTQGHDLCAVRKSAMKAFFLTLDDVSPDIIE